MLFNSGDTIYAPFNRGGQILRNDEDEKHTTKRRDVPQAYRVLSTVGGVPKAFARKLKQNSKNSPSIVVNEQGISDSGRLKNRYVPLYVYCLYVDFDSSRYDAVAEIFVFKPYEGKIDVRDLEAYPLHYLDARPNEFKIDSGFFLDRGRKFIDMTAVSHMTYEGLTIGENQEDINSAVIVDFRLAVQEFKPALKEFESIFPTFSHGLTNFWYNIKSNHLTEFVGSPCSAQWCYSCEHMNDRYVEQQKKQREKIEAKIKALLEEYGLENSDQVEGIERFKQYMEDHDLIRLLPGVVPGFALRNRRWIQADLRLLQNVKKEYGWNDLVLPKGHREMVQAMVETHAQRSRSTTGQLQDKIAMDLVGGRGNGCIILLHGAPGVGKTSTAECVAAYTKRPLYTITCGDIGYSPDAVEKDMQKHFKLAHKWGCVLLLDEADVFLAKRSKDDVKRNGLVSVFLRILEYYSGMMFLTTNRVGAIDDAFRSRLHLTLYYPKLDKKQTIKIWKTNLGRMYAINEERVQNGRLPIEFKADRIIKWVKKNWMVVHWNGRQIRNAFQTAIALGEFRASASSPTQAPVMDVKQFKTIATSSVQFNQYLLETHGADEDKTAKRDMIRTELDPAKMNLKQFVTSGDSFDSTEDSSAESDDYLEEDLDDSERDERKNFKARKKPNADRRATRRSQKTRRRSSPDQ
ncbi:P-loop containing nucleoside triphosphate hydrolase protein [Acephala macrosclerotiorum]|nr:P-loop containing nucleoside triphosphate hydrolase protein [Acephala macrosclerotiorum]